MILRLAAALALAIGVGGFGGYLALMGKLPTNSLETRHLREMKDRSEAPSSYQTMTARDFSALPRAATVAEYSGLERRGVVMEGYIQKMLRSPDGDFHLELAAAPPATELGPYVTAEISSGFRAGSRTWTWESLAWAFRPWPPWHGAALHPWPAPPRRVRLSGWLLFDFPHGDLRPGSLRVSAWEIHPVTAIEVWNETAAAWEPLAR